MPTPPDHPLTTLLRARATELGPTLAKAARARGLAVTLPDGSTKAIATSVTPVVVPKAEIARRALLSERLITAGTKMARAVIDSPGRELLLGCMQPLERSVVEASYAKVERLAICRTDFFVADRPLALEINATIPAMPGYSDIAARGLIEAAGALAGLGPAEIERLVEENGSNTRALHHALLQGYRALRGGRPNRIALLTRRNDSQLTELEYLAGQFQALGTEAEVVFPDELAGTEAIEAHGKRFDLVYRHLFVKRLEETHAPWVLELLRKTPGDPRGAVLNPPAAHIETKTNFALLSQAASDPELAGRARLTEEELSAIRAAVPWTRPLRHFPGVGPDGERLVDLAEHVAAHPERFVLKRAWEYGGKAVFVGRSVGEEGFEQRVKATYGESMGWEKLVMRAADDLKGGGFIAQEVVITHLEPHLLATQTGAEEAKLYVDFSAYASVGLEEQPAWGAVCRGSAQQIVNIVGGGGVLPLLTQEAADRLAAGMQAVAGRSVV